MGGEGGEEEGEGEVEGALGSHRGQVQVRDPAQAHLDPLGFQDLPHRHDHQVHVLAWPEPLGAGRRLNITTNLTTEFPTGDGDSGVFPVTTTTWTGSRQRRKRLSTGPSLMSSR